MSEHAHYVAPCHYPLPRHVIRAGRATYLCLGCGADVSLMAVMAWRIGGQIRVTIPADYMPARSEA